MPVSKGGAGVTGLGVGVGTAVGVGIGVAVGSEGLPTGVQPADLLDEGTHCGGRELVVEVGAGSQLDGAVGGRLQGGVTVVLLVGGGGGG